MVAIILNFDRISVGPRVTDAVFSFIGSKNFRLLLLFNNMWPCSIYFWTKNKQYNITQKDDIFYNMHVCKHVKRNWNLSISYLFFFYIKSDFTKSLLSRFLYDLFLKLSKSIFLQKQKKSSSSFNIPLFFSRKNTCTRRYRFSWKICLQCRFKGKKGGE